LAIKHQRFRRRGISYATPMAPSKKSLVACAASLDGDDGKFAVKKLRDTTSELGNVLEKRYVPRIGVNDELRIRHVLT
jgi:hypothetical protein